VLSPAQSTPGCDRIRPSRQAGTILREPRSSPSRLHRRDRRSSDGRHRPCRQRSAVLRGPSPAGIGGVHLLALRSAHPDVRGRGRDPGSCDFDMDPWQTVQPLAALSAVWGTHLVPHRVAVLSWASDPGRSDGRAVRFSFGVGEKPMSRPAATEPETRPAEAR
jgi:hypothetical protein